MGEDKEIEALSSVYNALKDLDSAAQRRVLDYVANKLNDSMSSASQQSSWKDVFDTKSDSDKEQASADSEREADDFVNELDGISPVAVKWIRRNDFRMESLGRLFSLGTDEIDLIAKSVPGNSIKSRTRAVVLLKAIAAYLSSGAARISAEQIKEACLHYKAYDSANHAATLKKMVAELSGNKSSGYSLTPRGLSAGTELVKEIIEKPSA
jgi:hypothetical protein